MAGVMKYTLADVPPFSFTGDVAACECCPVLEAEHRKQCRLTGEYLINTKGRGMWCPLRNFRTLDYSNNKKER